MNSSVDLARRTIAADPYARVTIYSDYPPTADAQPFGLGVHGTEPIDGADIDFHLEKAGIRPSDVIHNRGDNMYTFLPGVEMSRVETAARSVAALVGIDKINVLGVKYDPLDSGKVLHSETRWIELEG